MLAAAQFVLVECSIGSSNNFLGRFRRTILRPTVGRTKGDTVPVAINAKRDQSRQDNLYFVGRAFRENDHEFVTTISHREIGTTEGLTQVAGEFFQCEITCCVPIAVINHFEFDQIKEDYRQRNAVPVGARNFS
jgi:hypothetical protein